MKLAIKLKATTAAAIKHTRLAQLLQPSLAFCFSLQPNDGVSSRIGYKVKQNANDCNSCASLVCFIAAACCSCNNFKF